MEEGEIRISAWNRCKPGFSGVFFWSVILNRQLKILYINLHVDDGFVCKMYHLMFGVSVSVWKCIVFGTTIFSFDSYLISHHLIHHNKRRAVPPNRATKGSVEHILTYYILPKYVLYILNYSLYQVTTAYSLRKQDTNNKIGSHSVVTRQVTCLHHTLPISSPTIEL